MQLNKVTKKCDNLKINYEKTNISKCDQCLGTKLLGWTSVFTKMVSQTFDLKYTEMTHLKTITLTYVL